MGKLVFITLIWLLTLHQQMQLQQPGNENFPSECAET